eukprot:8850415-Karenia_brevis.AAC.1
MIAYPHNRMCDIACGANAHLTIVGKQIVDKVVEFGGDGFNPSLFLLEGQLKESPIANLLVTSICQRVMHHGSMRGRHTLLSQDQLIDLHELALDIRHSTPNHRQHHRYHHRHHHHSRHVADDGDDDDVHDDDCGEDGHAGYDEGDDDDDDDDVHDGDDDDDDVGD